jgi:hypothetical protein
MDFKTRASKSLPQVSHIFLESGLQKQGEEGREMRTHKTSEALESAAPELLDACKIAIEYIAEYCPEIGGHLTALLRAAIAKAEGGAL